MNKFFLNRGGYHNNLVLSSLARFDHPSHAYLLWESVFFSLFVLFKQIVDEGRVGRPFHYRATYNQDYTIGADVPQGGMALWRLDSKVAGSGVTGDLLAHCIDTALWLNGSINCVTAMTETFVKERKHNLTGKVEPVTIDDACAFLTRFDIGSLATFASTRYARGLGFAHRGGGFIHRKR